MSGAAGVLTLGSRGSRKNWGSSSIGLPFQGQKGYKDRVPSCFSRKWWVIFKDNDAALLNAIRYVENNPIKAGFKAQEWSCVTKYPALYQLETKGEIEGRE